MTSCFTFLMRVIPPKVAAGNDHVFHLYVIRVARRDRVVNRLPWAGVGAAIHYPTPVHLLPAYAGLGHRVGDFPCAERLAAKILSLQLYPESTPMNRRTSSTSCALPWGGRIHDRNGSAGD